jgi:uncharacterized protein (DUF697 family)
MRKNLPRAVTRTADDMREAAAVGRTPPAPQRPLAEPVVVAAAAPMPQTGPLIELLPAARSPEAEAARRHSLAARLIVERFATYAAVGGFMPLPIVNFSSVAAIIVRMVKVLSDHYGVPFQRDRARAIVAGLMAGAAPTGLGAVAASTLSIFVPGGLFLGMAVSSVTATACTRTIGRIFVEHYESGATLFDFPPPTR